MILLGYVYDIPRSTVALAGGIEKLLDLFASRARGYFRDRGESCEVFARHAHVEIRIAQDHGVDRVMELQQDATSTPEVECIALKDIGSEHWSPEHDEFASLVADWPEITAHRAIHEPDPISGFTAEQLAAARQCVIADKRASTSYLQRRLAIGYNKAAAIIERLEQDGVVSAPDHSGKRQVLVED